MKDAYLEARRAGATKEEAYAAAKAAYEKNHIDTDPRPQVDVPIDRSMTREQWQAAYREARIDGDYITYYHGTTESSAAAIRTSGVDLEHATRDMDFGRGFYATTLESQAQSWADKMGHKKHESGNVVAFDIPRSAFEAMNNKVFDSADSEWGSFVLGGRQGIQSGYDTVSGPYLSNVRKACNGTEAPKGQGQQTAFLTQKAISILNQSMRR